MAPRHADKGTRKIDLDLPKAGKVAVHSNQRVLNALKEIQKDMPLYHGVRLMQVLDAVFQQGVKEGKHEILDEVAERDKELEKLRPKRIGRPRKRS